jgi:hypothetical protein
LYSLPATERCDARISIRLRVLPLVGISLIFATAKEHRAGMAVMRSLAAGADTEKHTACWFSNKVADLKTLPPRRRDPCFSKSKALDADARLVATRNMASGI